MRMQERLAAGYRDGLRFLILIRIGYLIYYRPYRGILRRFTLRRIAERASHVASVETDEYMRFSGVYAFSLNREEDLGHFRSRLLKYYFHAFTIFNKGSLTPASLNPFPLKTHESHLRQGRLPPA